MKLLRQQLEKIEEKKIPQEDIIKESEGILALESLSGPADLYLGWLEDMESLRQKQKEKAQLERKLEELKSRDIDQWEPRSGRR